jgi:F-type H+-transporting ATPase subunit gamma
VTQTLQDLEHKIRSADDLHSVVRTMKTLAAVSIRQYEEAVVSLHGYYDAVELGLRAALLNRPVAERGPEPRAAVVLLFGSEQGMVGQFNEAVASFAGREIAKNKRLPEEVRYWVVGERLAGEVEERLGRPQELFGLPSSAKAIAPAVQDVVVRFEKHRRERGEVALVLFHNGPVSGAGYRQHRVGLLPPGERWLHQLAGRRWEGRCLPAFTLAWHELFSALIGEYLFVSIFRAFASSLAAENAARLAAMQRAEKNIDELRIALTAEYHAQRQNAVTAELFDVISGFEALASERGR